MSVSGLCRLFKCGGYKKSSPCRLLFMVEPARWYSNTEDHHPAGLHSAADRSINAKRAPASCRGSLSLLCFCKGASIHPSVDGGAAAADSDEVVRVLRLVGLVDPGDLSTAAGAGRALRSVGAGVVPGAGEVDDVTDCGRPGLCLSAASHDGAVALILQVDPAGAAFQLAPAVLNFHDGEGALAGLAVDGVAHARALAVVQVVDDDADQERRRRVACGRLGAAVVASGVLGGVCAQLGVDGLRDGTVALVEVLARAGLVGVVAVYGHIAAVGVADAVGLVGRPDQLLDAVTLADVRHQLDQGVVGLVGHCVGVGGGAGHFDGDRAVVILAAGAAPGAVRLIDGQTDGAVFADDVVGAALSVSGREVVAALLRRPLAHDAMDRDGVNGVVAGAGLVFGDIGICHQRAVAHAVDLLFLGCGGCVGVIVCLAIAGPLYFDGVALVGRALVPGQHDVGRLFHGFGCPEHLEHGRVAFQFLEHEVELHHQIADGRAGLPGVVEHGLLAAPVCPLRQAVAGAVADEVGIAPGVHGGRVLGVREAQALLVGVLEVVRIEPALGVEVAHQPGHSGRAETFAAEIVPDGPLGGGPCRLHGLLLDGVSAVAGRAAGVCQALADDVSDDSRAGHDQARDLGSHALSAAQGDDEHGHKRRHAEPELAAREFTDPVDFLHGLVLLVFVQRKVFHLRHDFLRRTIPTELQIGLVEIVVQVFIFVLGYVASVEVAAAQVDDAVVAEPEEHTALALHGVVALLVLLGAAVFLLVTTLEQVEDHGAASGAGQTCDQRDDDIGELVGSHRRGPSMLFLFFISYLLLVVNYSV